MLTALHDAPQLQRSCPELLELVDRSLASHPQRAVPATKIEISRAGGSFSLLEFTSDGLSKRTPVSAWSPLCWSPICCVSLSYMKAMGYVYLCPEVKNVSHAG